MINGFKISDTLKWKLTNKHKIPGCSPLEYYIQSLVADCLLNRIRPLAEEVLGDY